MGLLPRFRSWNAILSSLLYIMAFRVRSVRACVRRGGILKSIPRRRRRQSSTDPLAALSGALAERWDRFTREMARSRRRPTEGAIHDLRVAIRRLLAVMAAVDAILPGACFRRSSRQLRRHLRAFNALRDVHVQLLIVRGLKPRFPLLGRYGAYLRRQEILLVRAVRAEIRGMRQDSLVRSLSDAQSALWSLYGAPAASRAVGAMLKGSAAAAFGRVLARRAQMAPLDARSVHRLRVAFKKFRYTLELNRPFLPWADRAHARAMDEFQTAMGEIQDLEVLGAGLRRFARRVTRSTPLPLLPLFRYLASARTAKLNEFLHLAGRAETFWR